MNIAEMKKTQTRLNKIIDDERENISNKWQNELHRAIVIISNIIVRHSTKGRK